MADSQLMQPGGQLVTPYTDNSGKGNGIINPYLPQVRSNFNFWRQPVYETNDGTLWCPGAEGQTYASSAFDFVYFSIPNNSGAFPGTVQPLTPGICKVRITREREMDKKKPVGGDGARVTFHGVDAAEFDIEIKIWTPDQLRALNQLWAILFPAAFKKDPPNYDVQHPTLNETHGIKSAQFQRGSGPEISGDGTGIFTIHCVEFLKPSTKKAVSTSTAPSGSIYDPGTLPTPGSNTANTGP